MAQALEFQQAHLDRVSRSFAFCIRRLPQPLGRWVGLTYLVCRILDTIEDASWADRKLQLDTFKKFESAVMDPTHTISLTQWHTEFPRVPAGEELLLRDAHLVLSDLHELPEKVREPIKDLVLSMSSGMQHFISSQTTSGLRLASLSEVNQYCFFVAGVVGEALTQMVSTIEPRFPLNVSNLLRAHHFGLFLQKVNILKDQLGDEANGRWLVPSRDQLEASAQGNAAQALDFLCSIPAEQVEFRQFCGWSLFLGLETLMNARGSFLSKIFRRISRDKTRKLLDEVDRVVSDNQRLREFFFSQTRALGWDFSQGMISPGGASPNWFSSHYRGRLDSESLLQLGIGS